MNVSICMAVHNGESFLQEQLSSILCQLTDGDELVISDDGSTDRTREIIKSCQDQRIHLLQHRKFGTPALNFEYTLSHCKNEIIFLADQDDIWHPNKIRLMSVELASWDLAVCDCRLIDEKGNTLLESFFDYNKSQNGLLRNIVKNSFVGCCMAFHRKLLDKILPFPQKISMHDQWIGLMALRYFKVKFIPQILVDHRRHNANYSTTGSRSKNSWNKKVISKLQLAKAVWQN